jgi:phosphatidylinositol alpha-mannosyltransferase
MMPTYDLGPEGGGVKQHALHLAAGLRRIGDEVTILAPSSVPQTEPGIVGLRGVVTVRSNGCDNPLGVFVCPHQIRRFFRKNAFDVIHVHEPLTPPLSYWSTWLTRDTPHVATFHAYAEQEPVSRLRARRLGSLLLQRWFQRAIAVSEPARRYASLAWRSPIAIIPNGVPTHIFRPSPRRTDHGPVRLLFVGRLGDKRKGARFLFEAYEGLVQRGAPVTLDVVGELGGAPDPPALPGLTYHGMVKMDALVERYQRCDVLVAPSTGQESFGVILLEAMSSGKPIVCSDIDGYRQVVIPGGACLVQPGDSATLERALLDFVALDPDARHRMGEANLAQAQQYDWDIVARRVRREYLAALGLAVEAIGPVPALQTIQDASPSAANAVGVW